MLPTAGRLGSKAGILFQQFVVFHRDDLHPVGAFFQRPGNFDLLANVFRHRVGYCRFRLSGGRGAESFDRLHLAKNP